MGLTELLQRINEDKAFAEKYAGLAPDEVFACARQDGYGVISEKATNFLASIGKPDGALNDDDLSAVAGGANVNAGDIRSKEDILLELRKAGEKLRESNRERIRADRDAALAESLAIADKIRNQAMEQLEMAIRMAELSSGNTNYTISESPE